MEKIYKEDKCFLVSAINFDGCAYEVFGHTIVDKPNLYQQHGLGNGVGYKLYDNSPKSPDDYLGTFNTFEEAYKTAMKRKYGE